MKRLAAILLSVSLVCALSFLGGTGTAAGSTPAVTTASDTPTVTGELLNPAFFAHGAYVMQGVSDPVRVFALPLLGVPQLSFFPTASGIDPGKVTWRIEVSQPEGLSAEIRDNTLYIWGNSSTWWGYGTVTLTGTAGGVTGSAAIPVTVFRTDKTLVTTEGKKDYFVPWSPQLDIKRVMATEQFLAEWGYREQKLDRSVSWSAWRLATRMRSVTLDNMWIDALLSPGWTDDAQRRRIDVLLDELSYDNVDWLFIRVDYFMETVHSNEIVPLYNYSGVNAGYPMATMPDDMLLYFVNRAHSKGMRVAFGPFVQDLQFCRGAIAPTDWDRWFSSYSSVCNRFADLAREAGADLLVVGESLQNVSGTISCTEWGDHFGDVIASCRLRYPGPLTYLDGLLGNGTTGQNPTDWRRITFLSQLDYISTSPFFWGMIKSREPTADEIVSVYPSLVRTFILPLLALADKPLLFFENGIPSMDGILYHFEQFVAGNYAAAADPDEQAVWYEGLFRACWNADWLYGFGWYGVSVCAIGGPQDDRLTFQGKPAEDILRRNYGNGKESRRVIAIDADTSDWAGVRNTTPDPVGDAQAVGPDLTGVAWVTDDMYLYVMTRFQGEVDRSTTVTFLIDLDLDGQADIPAGVFFAGTWMGTVAGFGMKWQEFRGPIRVGLAESDSAIEVQIPLEYLGWPKRMQLRVEVVDSVRKVLVDQTSWIGDSTP